MKVKRDILRLERYINMPQDTRSRKTFLNILAMLLLKGGNILIGLLLVPMTISYVDSESYGIWLTISSMVAWISFLDIGINNGLRNKLTESIANGDAAKAKAYVSTTYAILTLIFIPAMIVALIIVANVDWQLALNVNNVAAETLVCSVVIVAIYFCINFIFSTINVILLADQRPAEEALRLFIQQLFTLVVIFALTKLVPGSLINLCLAMCVCPLVIIVIFNVVLFVGRYKAISPRVKSIDFALSRDLLRLGVMFFIIQIACVIQYQMTNFLIIHNFGANEVTSYNIAYKYFNVAFMVWSILTIPIWSAVSDAIAKNDYQWIYKTVRKYEKVFVLFVVVLLVMLAVSQYAYRVWVGDLVEVGVELSIWVMLFNITFMFGSIYVSVLNGASILKVQTALSIISPALFLGLCALLMSKGCGVESIIISAIVSNFNGLIVAPIQYRIFIKKRLESCE